MKLLPVWWGAVAMLCGGGAMTVAAAQDQGSVELSDISGATDNPRRHSRLRNPAEVSRAEAARIYAITQASLRLGYASSGEAVAESYQSWQQYNTEPYLSATHGNHYINNYANATARDYGRFEAGGVLPPGAVLVKDSFSITANREILLGPLFVMIKMPSGFNYLTGDWRYQQIQPDGTLLGETLGRDAARVEYCIACHLAREQHDHLYYVPEEYRRRD